MSQITFIGAGNMSQAIIRGLLASGYNPQDITATRRNLSKLQELHQTMQINITDDNTRAVHNADIIVLGVKPQDMQATCQSIALALANNKQRPIIISIAAGIILQSLTSWLNYNATIVRTMPNTPAMVGCGITGIFSKNINEIQKQLVDVIFCSVGSTIWVETEEQINIINAMLRKWQ